MVPGHRGRAVGAVARAVCRLRGVRDLPVRVVRAHPRASRWRRVPPMRGASSSDGSERWIVAGPERRHPCRPRQAGDSLCGLRRAPGSPLRGARSAFFYRGAARDLVSSFKHGGQRCLGPTMAGLAAETFGRVVDDLGRVVVTWVPSHGSVERTRGYNQAEVLARALADTRGGLPVVRLARKAARTAHQQGLGRDSRQRNLADAFRAVEWPTTSTRHRGGGSRGRRLHDRGDGE